MSKSAQLPRIRSKARPADQRPRLVERELERAQVRLRTVDTLYAICLLVGGLLSFLLITIGLDYWLHLSDGARQAMWGIAGVGALAFIGWRIVRPLLNQINPYFTARMIEKSTPGSRNGIINWLDLRDTSVSPIIRDSLSRRAVHELDSANMEEAIPTRKPIRTGLILGGIFLVLIALAILLPDQIGSLFQRAIFPFKPAIIPTHTRLEVLTPFLEPVPDVEVDTLPIREIQVERGQPVEFRVQTHGQIPQEVVMESQAAGDRQSIVKPMRQDKKGDSSQPWRLALSSNDIPVDGFLFWFRANDGATRKFKLVVTSKTPPSVSDLEVKLTFPAYTKRRPALQGMGPIKALVGTQVELTVQADRPVADGVLQVIEELVDGAGNISTTNHPPHKLQRPAEASDDSKLTLAEPWTLSKNFISKDTKNHRFFYQLTLVGINGLTGNSPRYPLDVGSDLAPRIEITRVNDKPLAKDQDELEVEANAVVLFAGIAHDDIAMDSVSFKLKSNDGRDLYFVGQPPTKRNMQKATGFSPRPEDFLLTLDLGKLTYDETGKATKPIQLKPGTIVEVVVEGSDYAEPKHNVGTSQLFKLRLKGDASNEQRKEQEKKAQDKQQQHDQQKKEKQDQQPENNQNEKSEKEQGNETGKEQSKDGSKESGKEQSKDGSKESGKEQSKDGSKESGKEQSKDGSKESGKEQSKDGNKESGKEQSKDGSKESGKEQSKDGSKESGKEQSKDGSKESGKEQSKEGSKESGKEQSKEGSKESGKEQSKDGSKESGKEQSKEGSKESGKEQSKDGSKESGKEQSKDGSKESGKEQSKDGSKESGKEQSKDGSKESGKEQSKEGSKESGKEQSKEGSKESGKEQSKEGSKESGKEQSKEGSKESGKEQSKDGSKESGKEQSKEGSKESGKEQSKDGSKESGKEQSKEGSKESGKEQSKDGSKESGKEQLKESSKESGKEQSKDGSKESGKEQSKDGSKESGKEQSKESSKESGKEQSKELGKEGDKGMAGGGQGTEPSDKGDLDKILEQVAKDDKSPKKDFNVKAAKENDKKVQEVSDEAARKRELALDNLAEKLKRGDIDRKLADKLKDLNLTREEALKLVNKSKLDRVKSASRGSDQGPGGNMTTIKRKLDQGGDPGQDVPDELSSSYRTFTERRNQQPKK